MAKKTVTLPIGWRGQPVASALQQKEQEPINIKGHNLTKNVYYASSFVPPEWIAAHGFRPYRILPDGHAASTEAIRVPEREGLCPYAADIAAQAGHKNQIMVFANTCDQMRRAPESVIQDPSRTFFMHIPATWNNPEAETYYQSELTRLGGYLEAMGGSAPSKENMLSIMQRYEAGRQELLASRKSCCARAHIARTSHFYQTGTCPPLHNALRSAPTSTPLMLLGSHLRQADLAIFDQIENAGAHVAIDATDGGEREWPRALQPQNMQTDPLHELAQAYFLTIPAVFRRPNDALYQWLQQAVETHSHLRGIIFVTQPWCDLWKAELPRLQSAISLPILHVPLGGGAHESRATRIEAFLEMIA